MTRKQRNLTGLGFTLKSVTAKSKTSLLKRKIVATVSGLALVATLAMPYLATPKVASADSGTVNIEVTNDNGYGAGATTGGAYVEYIGEDHTSLGSSGTGIFNSFVRIQDDETERGYNTNGTLQFDTKSGAWTHAIKLSEIPAVTVDPDGAGPLPTGPYWELFADINEGNNQSSKISLDDVEVWLTTNPNITGYPFANLTPIYDFAGAIKINDVNSGSGRGDLRYRIPTSSLNLPSGCEYGSTTCNTYFVLYTKWGGASGSYDSDGGFEEWKVKKYPTLKIVKNSINEDGTFGFTVTGPTSFTANITTQGGTGTVPANIVNAGTYTITENTLPSGWSLTSASCAKNGQSATTYVPGSNITISNGNSPDNVICTFTNTAVQPTLKLVKVVKNDNGGTKTPADFTLTATGDGGFTDSGDSQTFHPVKANVGYVLSESVVNGYVSEGWQCSGGSLNGSTLTLSLAQNVTCTVTNNDIQPKLTVVKVVENGNLDSDPQLSVSSFAPFKVGDVEVTVGQATGFDAGVYVVTETNQDNYVAVFSDDCNLQGSVTLSVGDNKTCTITNTYNRPAPKRGTIRIRKTVVNDNGGTLTPKDFTFNVNAINASDTTVTGNDFTVSENVGEAVVTAEVGSFSVTEEAVSNYTQDTVLCEGTVVAEEETLCEFVNNDKPGTIIVQKTVNNDSKTGSSEAEDFAAVLTKGETKIGTQNFVNDEDTTKGSTTFSNLTEGDYVVSESAVNGYTATYGGDCDKDGNVEVAIGQVKTCTITNNDNAPTNFDVSVTKTVSDNTPDVGQQINYTLKVENAGPATANGVVLTDVLPAGLSYVSDDGADATDFASDTLTWTVGNLTMGESKTLVVTVTVNTGTAGSSITNTASVPVDENDTNSENNTDNETVRVTRLYSLSGTVYEDQNENSQFDQSEETSEETLSGWTVYLDDNNNNELDEEQGEQPAEKRTQSNSEGYYEFTNLPEGCYTVREVLQSGWTQTEPTAGQEREYLVQLGNADCGFTQEVTLFNSVLSFFKVKTANAAVNTTNNTNLDFGNFKNRSGGGSSGGGGGTSGGGSGSGTSIPSNGGQVLGESTTVAAPPATPVPQVLGASTELPRTGLPVSYTLLVLALTVSFIASVKSLKTN